MDVVIVFLSRLIKDLITFKYVSYIIVLFMTCLELNSNEECYIRTIFIINSGGESFL